ncbi:MAG: DUF3987 domain-containing protein, partial [Thermogutta sp.]|nr:DUF3987 domain-containing protein [Thermogutta sp.]
ADGYRHRPSLSIAPGADGKVLLKCHAGCPVGRICDALDLRQADLFDDDGRPRPGGERPKPNGKPKPGGEKPKDGAGCGEGPTDGRVFKTAREALAELSRRFGRPPNAKWLYRDAKGEPVGLVCRWNTPDGSKEIRPLSLHAAGWRLAALPKPRPIFRLPEVLAADPTTPVVVTEGEKCCDAAARCGLLATTSSGGAAAAKLSDWLPVKGRPVVVLPDADEPGERYAEDVAVLCHAAGAASIRILRLADHAPGLPEGGDIADVLEDPAWCGLPVPEGATPKDVGVWILATAEKIEPEPAEADERPTWKPYPTESLPKAFRAFVEATSQAFGCDESYVALPLLAAAGAAVGLTRKLEAKAGWRVPPILWAVIVGESGSLKTPAIKAALRWTERRQARLLAEYAEDRTRFEAELSRYERDIAAWKRDKDGGDPPLKPEPPTARRILVADTTVEALGPILRDNPRGVLLARDELSGWLASFDRYANTTGGDSAFWLSAYGGLSHTVDRKTSGAFYIPAAAVCVTGGIQPSVLRRVLADGNYFENGLASRLLMAFPPRRRKRWTESGVPQWAADDVERVFDKLFALQHDIALDGEPVPHVMRLSPEAKERY